MIVYHGTGRDRLEGILRDGPRTQSRQYLRERKAFSTTTDIEIAKLFALRRSPPSILQGDESNAGVVIEYELALVSREGCDWTRATCPGVLQDEQEVAVMKPKFLEALAVWFLRNDRWVRFAMNEVALA